MSNKDVYIGTWNNDWMNGKGSYFYKDKDKFVDKYEGDF